MRLVITVVRVVSCRRKWSDYGSSGCDWERRSGEDGDGGWIEGYARLELMPLSSTSLCMEKRLVVGVP